MRPRTSSAPTVGAVLALGAVLLTTAWSAPAASARALDIADRLPAALNAPVPYPSSQQLADFFDEVVPARLDTDHVPGATISVVGDGQTVFSRGYGLADVERGTAFDPETSLVRIASISKLFTWTAVMQLVQDGRLDLQEDVNHYLTTFRIPETYSRPITLDDLMSHTAGFEDRGIGIGARSKADVPPLGTYLAEHIPARVRPPGEISAYSNYGAALAGHIVSQVSGEPYEQYVQDHILGPLGMRHSTAFEPVPARLAAGQARSYEHAGDSYMRTPFVFDKLVPDGSISATASDMARFMTAHLQDGRLGDAQVLDEATARLMHERSFAADPRIDGYAHGFKEKTINGHRVLMHDGGWESFVSGLLLVPDVGLGIFVSANSSGGANTIGSLVDDFFDRFVPAAESTTARSTLATGAGDGAPDSRLPGFYVPTRHTDSTIGKLLNLTGSSRLRVESDGDLVFGGRTWEPVAADLYRQVDGTERLAVVTSGSTLYLATDGPTYQRVPTDESITFNMVVLLGIVVTALTAALGLPVSSALRRLRKRPAVPSQWRTARLVAAAGAGIGLVFLVLMTMILLGDTGEYIYGAPMSIRVLLVLPLVFAALTVAAIVTTAMAVRTSAGTVGIVARVHQTAVLVGMLGLVWFCFQWNLFGWRFG